MGKNDKIKKQKWCELGFDHKCIMVNSIIIEQLDKIQAKIKKDYDETISHASIVSGLLTDYFKNHLGYIGEKK